MEDILQMGNANGPMKRILVVEDEPSICALCRRVLTEDGFKMDFANDGKTAQVKIAEHQYNLLFFDIRLPEMSGEELYLWLLQEYPKLADQVVFTTGNSIDGKTLDFLKRSGRPHLFKPFGRNELKAFIREMLGQIEK
jgi:DNA-binding response OmpR family regulator